MKDERTNCMKKYGLIIAIERGYYFKGTSPPAKKRCVRNKKKKKESEKNGKKRIRIAEVQKSSVDWVHMTVEFDM